MKQSAPTATTYERVVVTQEMMRNAPKQQNPKPSIAAAAKASPLPQRGFVARPVGYVLDRLPSGVSGRVLPLYQSYAAPAVEKVDSALDRIVTGAQSRIFKVKSRDDVAGMEKPGLGARLMAAAERGVDRVIPPARKPDDRVLPPAEPGSETDDSEDAELSTLRRFLTLVDTVRTRVYVHSEVKCIVMKVKANVWIDFHIKRRTNAIAARAKSLRSQTQARAVASKEACLSYEKRAETYLAGKCNAAKSTACEYTTALATKTSALKNKMVARAQPYLDALKLRMKPLTDRMTSLVQQLRAMERKCVGYAVAKKNMIAAYAMAKRNQVTSKAKAKIAPVQGYVAEKYDTTRATAAKYTTRTINSARAVVEKLLGRDRSAKLGGYVEKYMARIAKAVHAPAA